ncbi:MAG: hypothetical protein QM692_15660, partial [Thermomicrobiales bacterium]
LASIAPMLQRGNFAVVQKLMKITMDPVIVDALPEFLHTIPTESILKLYFAAANNDYRRRYRGEFAPAIAILESALRERGVLDVDGCIIPAAPAQLMPTP